MTSELLLPKGSTTPPSDDNPSQSDESMKENVYHVKGSTKLTRVGSGDRSFLYPFLLGIATGVLFTVLSSTLKTRHDLQPASKEGAGHPEIGLTPPYAVPPSAETDPAQGQQDVDKPETLSVDTAPPSPEEYQVSLKDNWGLPMLDYFEQKLPPSVMQGKHKIAEFIANGGLNRDDDVDKKDIEQLTLAAKALSNGSSTSLVGMVFHLSSVQPLNGSGESGRQDRCVRINKVLGTGGSAVVVEAEDTATRELFGMRIIVQDNDPLRLFENDHAFFAAIQQEVNLTAEAARQLCGPIPANLVGRKKGIMVPLYTAEVSGVPKTIRAGDYYVLSHVQLFERLAGNLDDMRRKAPDVLQESREYIARCLLQEVLKLQQAGFSHNDLKWDNLLLRTDGSFVISDLGSALPFGKGFRTMTFVTPVFREPQLGFIDRYNPGTIPFANSDLWSLGVILYELFTGRPRPYALYIDDDDDPDADIMFAKRLIETGTRSSALIPELEYSRVPSRWMQLLQRLLETDRTNRITSWEIIEEFPDLVKVPE